MWIFIVIVVIILIIIFALVRSYKEDDNGENYWEESRDRQKREYHKQEQEAFGKAGEDYVASMLEDLANSYDGYVFNDFTFMDQKGYSTNIDHIFVCTGGIFIIETKSYKGFIYGNDTDDMWYQEKEEWQDDKEFKNPVKQNQGHINHLRRMMESNPPKMISMIIFPTADSLRHVDSIMFMIVLRLIILFRTISSKISIQENL